jgi:Flp pilus assembly protein TadB
MKRWRVYFWVALCGLALVLPAAARERLSEADKAQVRQQKELAKARKEQRKAYEKQQKEWRKQRQRQKVRRSVTGDL